MNGKNNSTNGLNEKYSDLTDEQKMKFRRKFSDYTGIRGEKTVYAKLRITHKMTVAEQMAFDKAYKEVVK
jgi:hypothetical protein